MACITIPSPREKLVNFYEHESFLCAACSVVFRPATGLIEPLEIIVLFALQVLWLHHQAP